MVGALCNGLVNAVLLVLFFVLDTQQRQMTPPVSHTVTDCSAVTRVDVEMAPGASSFAMPKRPAAAGQHVTTPQAALR